MKISELQEGRGYLEEGPAWDAVKKVGGAVGQGLGAAAQAVGSVPGAAVGAGKAFMKGYRGARDTVAAGPTDTPAAVGTPAPTTPTAPAATAPAPTAPAPAPTAPAPKAPAASTPPATEPAPAPAPKKPGFMDRVKNMIGGKPAAPATAPVEPTIGTGPDDATRARIDAAPHGYNPETGEPNPAPAPTQNAAASDPYEKLKGDMRKITPTPGAKTLPAEMAAKLDGDMAKLAKGDKDSGAFAAQKILKFAQAGYDVSALQPKWMASSKAGERFLTQSVYREISKMLKEHGLTWANLGLRIRLNESVKGHGVFLSKRIATPVMPSANKIEESLKAKFKSV